MDKKYISKFINTNFFDFPTKPILAKIKGVKFGAVSNYVDFINPAIIICNKTSMLDKLFISKFITSDFVFLKDKYITKIHNNTLTDKEKNLIIKSIKYLKEAFVSVVIFPENNYSIFGKCEQLPKAITEFLYETTCDLKYLNLIGSYFTYPVWSKEPRRYEIKFTQQFAIDNQKLQNTNEDERNKLINNNMPSSASMYANKYPALIHSKYRAENFETIMYICPHCNNLFSLYSEFNCLKCRECGSALEFANDGSILLSNKLNSFDQIESFLFDNLKSRSFTLKELVTYKNISLVKAIEKKEYIVSNYTLTIYADRIVLSRGQSITSINFSDIVSLNLSYKNTMTINTKDNQYTIRGYNKENFYILIDLNKINKS